MADRPPEAAPVSGAQARQDDRLRISLPDISRLFGSAALLGLLAMAHLSAWPWMAHGLALLALVGLWFGNSRKMTAAALPADPVRAHRHEPDIRLTTVLDALPSPMILFDHRGHVVFANAPAMASFPGLRLGYPVSFAIRHPGLLEALAVVIAQEQERHLEIVERIPSERSHDVFVRRLSQSSEVPGNGVAFAVIVMTDTTAARRLEAMRADFVANASHELRTPLASILGFVETLQGAARDDANARKTFLPIMEAQARRMARLIDDLLSLSKIELNEHIPPSTQVNLPLLLRSVFDALGGMAHDRSVTLKLIAPDGVPEILGDRDELVRVFENLIENAIKYGQSGGRVDVSVAIEGVPPGMVAVHVRDYGPGIAEEHLPRLTERFYRADIAESRVLGGTGLGLAIVKHIVTRHRGRLTIASRLGEGATFSVTLPVVR